ncbi:hypothetical protein MKEN_01477600 [Mycena kentingensis (nom. inval.)]|nr:hypothetical protein MKEN_01477600 [Mycena kentingensis (nom. inval.)]
MPRAKPIYCTCELEQYPHEISRGDFPDHEEKLLSLRKARNLTDVNELISRLENMDLQETSVNHVADAFTSLAMIGVDATPVADATTSISAHSTHFHGPNRRSAHSLSASLSTAPTEVAMDTAEDVLLDESLTSMENIMQRAIPRPTNDTSEQVVATVVEMLDTAISALVAAADSVDDAVVRAARNEGSRVASVAATSLVGQRDIASKEVAFERLRQLELLVAAAEHHLPPDSGPVLYDSTYVYVDPVARLNVTAQIMIILGLVCNVILGLAIRPTNFIFRATTLLVKSVMATRPDMRDSGSDRDAPAAFAAECTELRKRLRDLHKATLQFGCWFLQLVSISDSNAPSCTKELLANKLIEWRLHPGRPLHSAAPPKTITSDDLRQIQSVIANTITPGWAKTYSSRPSEIYDEVHPATVLGHCARFDFSDNRSVFLFLSRE